MDRHFAGFRIKDKQTMGCVATCFLVLLIVLRNSCGQKLVILKKTAFQFGSKTKYPPPPPRDYNGGSERNLEREEFVITCICQIF